METASIRRTCGVPGTGKLFPPRVDSREGNGTLVSRGLNWIDPWTRISRRKRGKRREMPLPVAVYLGSELPRLVCTGFPLRGQGTP